MKWAFQGSELAFFFQQIKQQGFFRASKSALWRWREIFAKLYLNMQDHFGWYRYSDWIQYFEKTHLCGSEFKSTPRFLFFLSYSSSPQAFINDTLDSLLVQSYSNWQAYVYIDSSDALDSLTNSYPDETRINWILSSVIPPPNNLGRELPGDWFGFLNQGDTLAVHALASIVSNINSNPAATIIYSDTDRLSIDGKTRHSPNFWPDWSPELLLSVNYLSHALFSRDVFLNTIANYSDMEDALLRCSEIAYQVIHIPQVFFHQREPQAIPWFGTNFSTKNLIKHLERSGRQAVNTRSSPVANLPNFIWSSDHPLVSIIILTRDQVMLLERCIDSIFSKTSYTPFEIILVENHSQERETFLYYESLRSRDQVKLLIHDQEFNYSAFNNWGVRHAQGDLLLFLNNDIECIDPSWLEEMARWASRPEVGVVGAKLLYPNRAIQHAGLIVGLEGHANHVFAGCPERYSGLFGSTDWYRDYTAVTGACMMLRRSVFDKVGGFNEDYALAFNDIEICMKVIHAGYRIVYTPFSTLVHHEGATRSTYKPSSDIKLASKHLRPLIEQGDPFYNPNLSLMKRVPTLRRPGEISSVQRLDLITRHLS